ncbi:MAG: hypothetical protein V1754_09545 [Pseudomonadota bacterium]
MTRESKYMAKNWIFRAASLLLGLGMLLQSSVAFARHTKTFDHSYSAIWSTAIRLIRVDNGYKIRDKDKENGYILFVYPGSGEVKDCAASLEIIPTVDPEGFSQIRLQLSIAHQPTYVEVQFLEELENKLKQEQGDPPAPKREKKPKKEKNEKDGKDGKAPSARRNK